MAHYAFLDNDNKVTEVITGRHENEKGHNGEDIADWEQFYGDIRGQVCKRTSYNTEKNAHGLGGTPFRGNFAYIGFTYDEARDAFIPPQHAPSWTFNESTYVWDAPIAKPTIITEDTADPATWSYQEYWDEDAYQADNTKGWYANKTNDTADPQVIYEWDGSAWIAQ